MSRSPSRNQSSPPQALGGGERVPALALAAPPAILVDQARERVQEAVEIGRDVQPEDLEVVTDVSDDGEVAG